MTEIENELNLSLGDIIKVKSPYNDLNNKIFYIEYIDSKKKGSIILLYRAPITKDVVDITST